MSQENIELFRRALKGYNRRDISAACPRQSAILRRRRRSRTSRAPSRLDFVAAGCSFAHGAMISGLHFRPHPATVAIGAVIFALAGTGLLALGRGDQALASHVGCGDKITTDTRLDSDLVNCPNNGIVIGADGVTLNLNGHTIDGDGKTFAACPRRKICDVGVVSVGHDGVAVRHGSVRQFDVGVLVGSARRGRVLGVSSSQNRFFGFAVFDSARILVRDCSGSDNLAPDGDGMGLFGSHDIRILHNTFRHNPGPGIHIDESTDNLIHGTLFSQNAPAILITASNRNQVRGNRIVRVREAILVAPGNRNVIARNRVREAVGGIGIETGRGNVVARNVVVGARRAGIRLGIGEPSLGGGSNVVRGNLVRGSGDDGFVVFRKDDHSLLRRNLAVGAGDDGFDVRSRTAKLTVNRAVRNGDLGIEAVHGVTDDGGNIARVNGDPRQCVNVACK
jgi:nitrous oxidase accessory protein NosD